MPESTPDNPAGPFSPVEIYDEMVRGQLIDGIRNAPEKLQAATDRLTEKQLDTKYRNWTIRQITHHMADSHLHSLIRFKWTLTENNPTIKAYEEADWVLLDDSRRGEIAPALALFCGLHQKWVQLLESMTSAQFGRTFVHPQTGETVSLWMALNYYPWHCRHHTAQILWLRDQHGW